MPTDKQLVTVTQPWEPAHVMRMLRKENPGKVIDQKKVKEVILKAGKSREIIYGVLQLLFNYETPPITINRKQNQKIYATLKAFVFFESKPVKDQKFKNAAPYGHNTR